MASRMFQRIPVLLTSLLLLAGITSCGDDSTGPAGPNLALLLDGTNDFVAVPMGNYTFTTFTVEARIRVPVYTSNLHYVSLYQTAYLILGDYDTKVISTWADGLAPVDAGSGATQPTIAANEWHHIAFSFDGTNQYILIDGVAVDTVATTGTVTNNATTYNQGLTIGARYARTSQFVTGQIDEVRVWNVYRTPAQILANKDRAIGRQNGLVGYWNFDDGTAKDLSGNGADGVLTNGALIIAPQP
jgi:hypothetical protein